MGKLDGNSHGIAQCESLSNEPTVTKIDPMMLNKDPDNSEPSIVPPNLIPEHSKNRLRNGGGYTGNTVASLEMRTAPSIETKSSDFAINEQICQEVSTPQAIACKACLSFLEALQSAKKHSEDASENIFSLANLYCKHKAEAPVSVPNSNTNVFYSQMEAVPKTLSKPSKPALAYSTPPRFWDICDSDLGNSQ